MAKKSELLKDVALSDQLAMTDTFAALHRWGFITRTQLAAMMDETRKHLPCDATVTMRTRKGMVYVNLNNGHAFTVSTRAKVEAINCQPFDMSAV